MQPPRQALLLGLLGLLALLGAVTGHIEFEEQVPSSTGNSIQCYDKTIDAYFDVDSVWWRPDACTRLTCVPGPTPGYLTISGVRCSEVVDIAVNCVLSQPSKYLLFPSCCPKVVCEETSGPLEEGYHGIANMQESLAEHFKNNENVINSESEEEVNVLPTSEIEEQAKQTFIHHEVPALELNQENTPTNVAGIPDPNTNNNVNVQPIVNQEQTLISQLFKPPPFPTNTFQPTPIPLNRNPGIQETVKMVLSVESKPVELVKVDVPVADFAETSANYDHQLEIFPVEIIEGKENLEETHQETANPPMISDASAGEAIKNKDHSEGSEHEIGSHEQPITSHAPADTAPVETITEQAQSEERKHEVTGTELPMKSEALVTERIVPIETINEQGHPKEREHEITNPPSKNEAPVGISGASVEATHVIDLSESPEKEHVSVTSNTSPPTTEDTPFEIDQAEIIQIASEIISAEGHYSSPIIEDISADKETVPEPSIDKATETSSTEESAEHVGEVFEEGNEDSSAEHQVGEEGTSSPADTESTVSQEPPLREGYERHATGVYRFDPSMVTWSRAKATCESEGAHLAVVNSEAESQVLREMFDKYPDTFWQPKYRKVTFASVGFHDKVTEGEYVTIFGAPLNSTGFSRFWRKNEPNNLGGGGSRPGEDCGSIHRNGGLNDFFCLLHMPFFCEIRL